MTGSLDPKQNNYRRFEEGESQNDWELTEKIFQADHSHKCPTYVHRTPPCQGSCPSGHEIRGWLAVARGMDKPPVEGMAWQEHAFRKMVAANPFPSTMGRVCPAPCEDGCNRNELDDFVGINAVEQYVGDWARDNNIGLEKPAEEDTGKKIAVVGSGPAGLTAAYFLRLKGHDVTVFEEHDELGGMMRYGIPNYRTPRDMLDGEIKRILDTGVKAKTSTRVGKDISVEQLDKDFDAIFWAVGAQKGRGLFVDHWAETENCVAGVKFLDMFNKGELAATVKKIVVVGGGDTSIDVASVARRLGHISKEAVKDQASPTVMGYTAHDVAGTASREGVQATLTSLFPIDEMTAAEHEREDALREGVDIKGGVMPLELVRDENGRATALRMAECTVDNKGIPSPVEGTEFDVEADLIVSAIGQFGDLEGFEFLDNGRGLMNVNPFYSVEEHDKHFAGGDIVRPHLLTTAIGQGRIASETIHNFVMEGKFGKKRPKVDVHHFNLLEELQSRGLEPEKYQGGGLAGTSEEKFAIHNFEDRSNTQIIPADELFLGYFEYVDRKKRNHVLVDAEHVVGNFDERIKTLEEEQATQEGERCMSCGMCFECDNCVIFCPQDAISRVKPSERAVGRYVQTDYTKCIGCHICKDVCPTGYIEMGLGE